jgi:hypothetical protein
MIISSPFVSFNDIKVVEGHLKLCHCSLLFGRFLFGVLSQEPLSEEGQNVEETATNDQNSDNKNPVLPSHWNDTEGCNLKRRRQE